MALFRLQRDFSMVFKLCELVNLRAKIASSCEG